MSKSKKKPESEEEKNLPGDPSYSEQDDIYSKSKKESLKEKDDMGPEGLDVPGAELDDADEQIGEEDEENNYYSLGGDDHNDLEEDPS
ncbi:MAG TPA: hypothetical protein VHD35_04710 [Chitinophagaceae bacterium]|nr:hypothetical protein [Chitinophagaceae bacterium]